MDKKGTGILAISLLNATDQIIEKIIVEAINLLFPTCFRLSENSKAPKKVVPTIENINMVVFVNNFIVCF